MCQKLKVGGSNWGLSIDFELYRIAHLLQLRYDITSEDKIV